MDMLLSEQIAMQINVTIAIVVFSLYSFSPDIKRRKFTNSENVILFRDITFHNLLHVIDYIKAVCFFIERHDF